MNRRRTLTRSGSAISARALNNILTDKDDAFLDIHDNIRWRNEKYFTWTSNEGRLGHLYKVSRMVKTEVIKGHFMVNINCIDPAGGCYYSLAGQFRDGILVANVDSAVSRNDNAC